MAATTVKLDSALRDRLNAAARERGVTTGSFIETLLESWLREQRFARLREELARTPPDVAYADDAAEWDVTLADR